MRAALLDMYNGESNRGIPMLKNILAQFADVLTFDHFDVRAKGELPGLDYDIYVFSGGPGNPLINDFPAFHDFFRLIEQLWDWNRRDNVAKKHCLFICHSFQMVCHHFRLGEVTHRDKMSFGTYPVHKTHDGKHEWLFENLPDPFYIADFRRFQVVSPRVESFKKTGAEILCLEKLRPHVHHERAIMAVRFSEEMIGMQFHPEADPQGMLTYFLQDERRIAVTDEYGEPRYHRMIRDLANPEKIKKTFDNIVPGFLNHAVATLKTI